MDKIRNTLNLLFLIGAIASVIVYFTVDDRHVFFYVCGAAIFLKLVEFFLRLNR